MGSRPSLNLVCGITDLEVDDYNIIDPRYTKSDISIDEMFETCPPIPPKDEQGEWLDIRLGTETLESAKKNKPSSRTYQPKDGYELIDFDPEFGVSSAIGYKVDNVDSQTILYAMASIFPTFEHPKVIELFSIPLDEDYEAKRYLGQWLEETNQSFDQGWEWLKSIDENDLDYRSNIYLKQANRIGNNQNYQFFNLTIESYTICAEYLLRWIGLDVKREDMKLFLHYKWS